MEEFKSKSTTRPIGLAALMLTGNGAELTVTEDWFSDGLNSHTWPLRQVCVPMVIGWPDWFRIVNSGLANVRLMLLYVSAGAFTALRRAFSVSSCVSSTSIGLLTKETAGLVVSDGCRLAPVTLISKDKTETPAGGLSRIDRLSDRGASGCVVWEPPPQPPTSAAVKRTAEVRNASFLILVAPFKNLSPKLDRRMDLVSRIKNPPGKWIAKINRTLLRAAIACASNARF